MSATTTQGNTDSDDDDDNSDSANFGPHTGKDAVINSRTDLKKQFIFWYLFKRKGKRGNLGRHWNNDTQMASS